MKYILVLCVCLFVQICQAQEMNRVFREKWVGVLWSEGQEPIINSVIFDEKQECLDFMKNINEISKKTVNIDRKQTCKKVIFQR